MYASRKALIEAEISERIRRALRKNVRTYDEHYETGDKVYKNVLIQINGEDQDTSFVEMELWYLYAMEEHMLEFTSVDFRKLKM